MPVFFCCNICMTLDLTRLICSKLRENVCFCAAHPPQKKFTLPGEIIAYIVMLKRLVFTKRNKGEAVASPGGHWLGSSCHFLFTHCISGIPAQLLLCVDRDQIDLHTLSQHLQVWECEEGGNVNSHANFDLIKCSCTISSVCWVLCHSHITNAHNHKYTKIEAIRLNYLSHISTKYSCGTQAKNTVQNFGYFFCLGISTPPSRHTAKYVVPK